MELSWVEPNPGSFEMKVRPQAFTCTFSDLINELITLMSTYEIYIIMWPAYYVD